MNGTPAIAAVDWGTTRIRVWLLDEAGSVLAERRGDDGLIAAQEIGFSTVLQRHLAALSAGEKLPAIICGMAGSRQGWIEAPYIDTPTSIRSILKGAMRVESEHRDVRIIPGLAQRTSNSPDVMRGEETQLAGAGLPPTGNHLVCMPGTHSKWVAVEDSSVAGFGTWPTGELFSVLAEHSILRHSLGGNFAEIGAENANFLRWCRAALKDGGDITSKLFSIRAAGLLQGLKPDDAAASLSGLLIGGEVASARRRYDAANGSVVLVASGALGQLYAAVLDLAGLSVRRVDADDAVRSGLLEAAQQNHMMTEIGAAI